MSAAPTIPAYPNTNAHNIPFELLAYAQFVAWRWEWREGAAGKPGKWTKVLINPRTGRNARSNDPSTWGTLDEAVNRAIRDGIGVGFVFRESDPFAGVDFDDCLDPETGEVDPIALERIRALDSYTEVSPSGRGVKVIVCAKLPPEGRRRGKVEMYDSLRFFTLTGNHFPGSPATIEDRQHALDELHHAIFGDRQPRPTPQPAPASSLNLSDHEVIARARNSRQGAKFDQLMAGQWEGWFDSQSEADLSLANMLRFWSGGDRAQVDRIFRTSGLYREKWERPDYRERRVLDVAFAGGEVYRPAPTLNVSPATPQMAAGDAEALEAGQDPCAARVIALEGQLASLQAQYDELSHRHATMTQVLMNPNLSPTEAIAAVLVISEIERKQASGKIREDGRCPVYLDDIAKSYTLREKGIDPDTGHEVIVSKTIIDKPRLSRATISRALDKFDEWGMIEKTVITPQEQPRERRGKTPKTELYVRPLHSTTRETLQVLATYNPNRVDPETGREKRHGGSLPKDQRPFRCDAHPDADVVLKTEAWCSDCGEFLGTIGTETIPPPALQDETREDSTAAHVEDVLTGSREQRGSGRSHPHRRANEVHHETRATGAPTCCYCPSPLYAPESIARGTCTRHATAPPASEQPFTVAAGGDD